MRWLNLFSYFFVGLFAALMVFMMAASVEGNISIGVIYLRVIEPTSPTSGFSNCTNDRTLVLQIFRNHATINHEEISEQRLPAVVAEIMKTRAEKSLFVWASRDIDFERFAVTLGKVQAAVPDLHFIVLTDDDLNNPGWCIRYPKDAAGREVF